MNDFMHYGALNFFLRLRDSKRGARALVHMACTPHTKFGASAVRRSCWHDIHSGSLLASFPAELAAEKVKINEENGG
jgi:hypothetical protein